jgi:3-methyl-2-oxobutanoate hydroxymethyltransferase
LTQQRNGRESKPERRDKKVTTKSLQLMKRDGKRIVALTAYDYLMAELLDQAGVDVILVGDSAAMAVQGRHTTVSVTMEQMLYHAELVSSAVERALVVGDLPFMSYQVNADEALRNAGRMIQEAHVEAVKLEGGLAICPTITRIVEAGIPVMGHLGLTPQSIHRFGTYQVRAKEPEEADEVRRDAKALEQAGAFALVLEKVPAALATEVARSVAIPVVGIGAGGGCDGQILVSHDMLGLYSKFHPRFVRRYAELGSLMKEAFARYAEDVRKGDFPAEGESY